MYTHNIEALIAYAESLELKLYVPTYFRNNSLIITDWEAGSRYDVAFSIRIDKLKKAALELKDWYIQLHENGFR